MVPEVEAPEGSSFKVGAFGAEACLGRVPEVDGVGDECELLAVVELVEFELAGVVGVGCNLGTVVQLYWNSGTVSSSPVRNL